MAIKNRVSAIERRNRDDGLEILNPRPPSDATPEQVKAHDLANQERVEQAKRAGVRIIRIRGVRE